MHTLVIQHVEGAVPDRFFIQCADGRTSDPVEVHSPASWPVEGGKDGLSRELDWGRAAFNALFGSGPTRELYLGAVHEGLRLQVRSEDPRVLAWPWEALENDEATLLALSGRIERTLGQVGEPPALAVSLPRERVNILVVLPRPYEQDIGSRSAAAALVELVAREQLPVHVTVLRPPTFENLQRVLAATPDTFHILHFDGHAVSASEAAHSRGGDVQPSRLQGRLVFEAEDGEPDEVPARKLASLLRKHRLPTAMLSACPPAEGDAHAASLFASVAATLLEGGVRGLATLGSPLHVSGARHFLSAFYETLFATGDLGSATCAGRKKLFERAHPFADWLVPVAYQQAALDLSFADSAVRVTAQDEHPELPREAHDDESRLASISRNGPLLELERAMRRPPVGILLHGPAGIGKTTLVRGFLHWLSRTGGLGEEVFWFNFNDIRSAEHVINPFVVMFQDSDALWQPMGAKVIVARQLRHKPYVLVWDQFESTRGLLSAEDQAWLERFLEQLRGGKTRVLIISHGEETWLDETHFTRLRLGGLQEEERWSFRDTLLRNPGGTADRRAPDVVALMDALEGHPLMMRMVLPHQEDPGGEVLLKAWRETLTAPGLEGDAPSAKVVATLRFFTAKLPEELRSLLVPLGLHERFAESADLVLMGASVPGAGDSEQVERLFGLLEVAGLVSQHKRGVHALQPVLTRYLRTLVSGNREDWERAFVERMEQVARQVKPWSLREQRDPFFFHRANFHRALGLAKVHGMAARVSALTHALTRHSLNLGDLTEAEHLSKDLVEWASERDEEGLAVAFHLLGRLAHERCNLDEAVTSFHKALVLEEKQGNELSAGNTCHQLGKLAWVRRNYEAAEHWFRKSVALWERQGDAHGTARTCHQLGRVAEQRRDFEAAETWFLKALVAEGKQGSESSAVATYLQFGRAALERRDFDAAETWYLKAIALEEQQGHAHDDASTYHWLAEIAKEKKNFKVAETWLLKALAIEERQLDTDKLHQTYFWLGGVAEKLCDFEAAETWYLKSLAIRVTRGEKHGESSLYGYLSRLAEKRRDFEAAETWHLKKLSLTGEQVAAHPYHSLGSTAEHHHRDFEAAEIWYLKALALAEERGDESLAGSTYELLGDLARNRKDFEAAEAWYLKLLGIVEKTGERYGTVYTYHQLGKVAQSRRDLDAAETWFRKALALEEKQGNAYGDETYKLLAEVAEAQQDFEEAEKWFLEALALVEEKGDEAGTAAYCHQLGRVLWAQRDLEAAEAWFLKSLALDELRGEELTLANTAYQLGSLAHEQRNFEAAETWYRKAVVIEEKLGPLRDAAVTNTQLGIVARKRRNFEAAQMWYRKALAHYQELGDERGAGIMYSRLAKIAQRRRDFAAAEAWYLQLLAIREKQGDEDAALRTYEQLASVAEEREDLEAAETWLLKVLALEEKQGNAHDASVTCSDLGRVALNREDFASAKTWYLKSLALEEKQGDESAAARIFIKLGRVARERQDFEEAEAWYLKALAIDEKLGKEGHVAGDSYRLGRSARARKDFAAARSWYLKALAIEEKLGREDNAAMLCYQLGAVAQAQRELEAAWSWYLKSLAIREKQGKRRSAAGTQHQLGILAMERGQVEESASWLIQGATGFARSREPERVEEANDTFVRLLTRTPEALRPRLREMWTRANLPPLRETDA